jgi:hypothetical protein
MRYLIFYISLIIWSPTYATGLLETACQNGVCPGLGRLFYLPDVNAISSNTGGRQFFKVDPSLTQDKCAKLSSPINTSLDQFTQYQGMSSFVNSVNSSSNLSGDVKVASLSMKATAELVTGFESKASSSAGTIVFDRSYLTSVVDLQDIDQCMSVENIDPTVLQAFARLPSLSLNSFIEDGSWNPYIEFLKNHGSHIITQSTFGSRFQIWESNSSSSSETLKLLEAKACVELNGTSGEDTLAIAGCSAYDQNTRQQAASTSSNQFVVIRGGDDATRKALQNHVTSANMDAFINKADVSDQAVRWEYTPVWRVFQRIYQPLCSQNGKDSQDCVNYQNAVNLEAAYSGFMAWSCTKQDSINNITYQGMYNSVPSGQVTGYWSCKVAKEGCNNDDDCHYRAGVTSGCYGPSCFKSVNIPGTNQNTVKVQSDDDNQGTDVGVNQSCEAHFWGSYASCKTGWSGGVVAHDLWNQAGALSTYGSYFSSYSSPTVSPSAYTVSLHIESSDLPGSKKAKKKPLGSQNFAIRSIPEGIFCPGAGCDALFSSGTNFRLVWIEERGGANFVKWQGDACNGSRNRVKNLAVIKSIQDKVNIHYPKGEEIFICDAKANENMLIDANVNLR